MWLVKIGERLITNGQIAAMKEGMFDIYFIPPTGLMYDFISATS